MGFFGELFEDALSLPFRAAQIPANVVAEIAAKVDPDDDAAIRSLARELADIANAPLDACEKAIREALR